MLDLKKISNILLKFSTLPKVKKQYIVNWFSVRYLAVIFKKCNESQLSDFRQNMSKSLISSVEDEIRTFGRELDKQTLVDAVFSKLDSAVANEVYNHSYKDSSYKIRKKPN